MRNSWTRGTIADRVAARWFCPGPTSNGEQLDIFRCLAEARRILIVPNDRVGGFVLGASVCKVLRQCYPEAKLHLLVDARWSSLASQVPYVDAVIDADLSSSVGSAAFQAVERELKRLKLDLGFCLGADCSFRMAQMFLRSGARLRVGFPRQGLLPHNVQISTGDPTRNEVEQYTRMLQVLGIQGDTAFRWSLDARKAGQMRKRYLADNAANCLVGLDLNGGEGRGLARRQTEQIIGQVVERGAHALLFLTAAERKHASALTAMYGDRVIPFEQRDLATAALLLPACDTLIACNTDLLHMGMALQVPVVGLFEENPHRWVQCGNAMVEIIQATDVRNVGIGQVGHALDEALSQGRKRNQEEGRSQPEQPKREEAWGKGQKLKAPAGGDADHRAGYIAELVCSTYEDPRVVARYAEIGLWLSEKMLVLEHVPNQGSLLDLGCGAGRTSIPLAEMGLKVTGVDVSEAMIAVADEQARSAEVAVDFRQMDARCLDFADASFDAALFSYNGFELVPGRKGKEQALAEIQRVLRPGGCLIFSTHSLFALNRFAPARMANLLKVILSRVGGFPCRAREVGERFIDDPLEEVKYIQILPPGAWLRMLRSGGFDVVYYNTRRRLECRRPWRWWSAWEDGERFYVGRKR